MHDFQRMQICKTAPHLLPNIDRSLFALAVQAEELPEIAVGLVVDRRTFGGRPHERRQQCNHMLVARCLLQQFYFAFKVVAFLFHFHCVLLVWLPSDGDAEHFSIRSSTQLALYAELRVEIAPCSDLLEHPRQCPCTTAKGDE